ncbi:hypothetical protein [Roseateles asaccharophilus]|uniref:Secreted protein n=1 Tax=Roseateles asaccharophilus TaxID=582607 RepID=A0ABU2A3E2_9BURK|nr:hypothetical protein [Roseateles asaccharophilus]MDR7331710.1 hypothetical protein [Roseateles asaccharophilus]
MKPPVSARSGVACAALLTGMSAAALAQEVPSGWVVQGRLQGFVIICQAQAANPADRECKPWLTNEQVAQMAQSTQTPAPVVSTTNKTKNETSEKTAAKPTAAKDESPQSELFQQVAAKAKADLTVPASPAFAILGLSPDKVQRPGLIRDFAASLVHGLSPDGKVTDGVAMDFSPMSLFFRDSLRGGTLYGPLESEKHRDLGTRNYLTRVAARTTVSLATTKPDADGAARAAWGVRIGLWDQADPGLYYDIVDRCLKETKVGDLDATDNLDSKPVDLSSCYDAVGKQYPLWAQPSLYAGFGKSWYTGSGALKDATADGKAVWVSGSYGFPGASDDSLRVLLQGFFSRRLDDRAPDPTDSTRLLRQDSTEASVRLRMGRPTYHAYGEWGRRRVRLGETLTERLRTITFGAEIRLPFSKESSEYWLQIASVRERGFSNGKDRNAVNMSLRFGMPFLEVPGSTGK